MFFYKIKGDVILISKYMYISPLYLFDQHLKSSASYIYTYKL